MEPVVMIIGPHPDDAEIGMGGTIAAMVEQSVRVIVVDLTDGEPTPFGSREIRRQETQAASKILGIKERLLLDIPNRGVFDTLEHRKKLASVIRTYKPSVIFGPYWEDAHPDHVHACQLVESARFYSKFVKSDMPGDPHYPRKLFHYFSTHIRPRFQPSFVFDISRHIDTKLEAVAAYRSQFADNDKNQYVLSALRTEGAHWGFSVQSEYGEPFICRENIRMFAAQGILHA